MLVNSMGQGNGLSENSTSKVNLSHLNFRIGPDSLAPVPSAPRGDHRRYHRPRAFRERLQSCHDLGACLIQLQRIARIASQIKQAFFIFNQKGEVRNVECPNTSCIAHDAQVLISRLYRTDLK